MTQRKDSRHRARKSAKAVRWATGVVTEGLEQRTLLAATPVEWSSYLGGSAVDVGNGIALDGQGNCWVAGKTATTDLASAGFDTTYNGGSVDGFVAKIGADGALAWSSYLGGNGADNAYTLATDGQGNAWVAGVTNSTDLAGGGFDTSYNGGIRDGFVAKINADGTLAWVSYLGGSVDDEGLRLAIDGAGNAWVTGYTSSSDLASGGFDSTYNGGSYDGFVAKINANGMLAWSSYLGGSGDDEVTDIAIDGGGNAWVTGSTTSPGWTSGGFDTTFRGLGEGFVAKINAGGALAWSSYLPLGGTDYGNAIAIDHGGNAWVVGQSGSLAKINADGTLAWVSNNHQGINSPECSDIAIDNSGYAWVTGGDFRSSSGSDAFVAMISPTGTWTWLYYLGPKQVSGISDDVGNALAIDGNGSVWVTGQTYKPAWTGGGFDTTYGGGGDAFVVKVRKPSVPVAYDQDLSTSQNFAIDGTMTASDSDADPLTYSVSSQPTHGTLLFTPDGAFTYTPNSGYEGADSFTFKATDGTFDSNVATIGITITHLQANLSPSPSSILENQPSGTMVGTFSVSGPDAISPFAYSLVSGAGDDNNASFTISDDQLLSAASFDYETKSSYSIRVRITDSASHTFEQAFIITVMNVNEAPTNLYLSNATVLENQPPGLTVGTLTTTDPDTLDTFTYSLVDGAGGNDNASFAIGGNGLLTAASFSLADRGSYSIRIRTTDAAGLSFEKAFTISVVDTILSNTSIPENQPSGTFVGTVSCANPDYPSAFSYQLVNGQGATDNGSFVIVGNQLLAASPFDYESQNTFSIRIRSTTATFVYENVFVISVSNVGEAPTNLTLSSTTVQENLPYGTEVGTFQTVDPDAGESFTYSFVNGAGGEDNACFIIDGDQLLTSMRFNYEFRKDYSIRVRATDSGGLSYDKTLTIDIGDDPGDYRGAFGWAGGKKGTKLTLPDADGDLVTFTLSGTGTGKVYGFEGSFEDLIVTGSGPKTAVTITVKKPRKTPTDKLMTLGNVTTDGPIKSFTASASILSGLAQFNTQNMSIPKAKASLKLLQISDSDIRVQNLPLASIAVKGGISGTRILTDNSIKALQAATLLHSEILVGMATGFEGDFAISPSDFTNPTATLGSLKISGRKLSARASHPADVANSHISAPLAGTLSLMNLADTSAPMVHVMKVTGTLKVSHSKLTLEPMFAAGTWKLPAQRPPIWETLP